MSCYSACLVMSPVLWCHLSCYTLSFNTTCFVTSYALCQPVFSHHLSCYNTTCDATCLVIPHLEMLPVLWHHLPCDTACLLTPLILLHPVMPPVLRHQLTRRTTCLVVGPSCNPICLVILLILWCHCLAKSSVLSDYLLCKSTCLARPPVMWHYYSSA